MLTEDYLDRRIDGITNLEMLMPVDRVNISGGHAYPHEEVIRSTFLSASHSDHSSICIVYQQRLSTGLGTSHRNITHHLNIHPGKCRSALLFMLSGANGEEQRYVGHSSPKLSRHERVASRHKQASNLDVGHVGH